MPSHTARLAFNAAVTASLYLCMMLLLLGGNSSTALRVVLRGVSRSRSRLFHSPPSPVEDDTPGSVPAANNLNFYSTPESELKEIFKSWGQVHTFI